MDSISDISDSDTDQSSQASQEEDQPSWVQSFPKKENPPSSVQFFSKEEENLPSSFLKEEENPPSWVQSFPKKENMPSSFPKEENLPSGVQFFSKEEENLPAWVQFRLKQCYGRVEYSAGVIIGHYLIVLAHHVTIEPYGYEEEEHRQQDAILLAFSLQDHTIQEAKGKPEDLFVDQEGHYSLLKYGENQIIRCDGYGQVNMIRITVESFEPFKVKCEKIDVEDERRCSYAQTAQVYKDKFYVLQYRKELWSFDLKNYTWELCKTTGEVPEFTDPELASFIYQDYLYIYGVADNRSKLPHLFMLDFRSMKWKKITQQEKYLGARDDARDDGKETRFGGTVYQGHLVTLEKFINHEENRLCFLNLQTPKTWLTFDIKGIDLNAKIYDFSRNDDDDDDGDYERNEILPVISGLMTYKNYVLSLTAPQNNGNLVVAIMNIENFGISAPKSAEEEYLNGLFLSQNKSDITFKIEENVIPAHKFILMKKSQYFAGLFNSGMAESTQDVIEIKDCEYEIFKEYLRWIYQGKVNISDANQAIKLHILTDKYVQIDLCEKCLDFLTSIIDMNNVYTILNFAHQENVPRIKAWCTKLFNDKLTVQNVAELIEYLYFEPIEDNKGFRDQALKFVLDNFFKIYEDERGNNMEIYKNFLERNVEIDTILPLAKFLSRKSHLFVSETFDFLDSQDEEEKKRKKRIFEELTVDLKEGVFRFIEENTKVVMASKFAEDLPNDFFRDLFSYTAENLSKTKIENQALKNAKKRMEPSHINDFDGNEGHELKKTKKSDSKEPL